MKTNRLYLLSWLLALYSLTENLTLGAIYQDAAKLAAGTAYGADPMFNCVGVIDANTTAGTNGGSCVLIAPQWGLTAAHVMTPYSGATVTSATASFGATPGISPICTATIDSWQVYPGYTYNTPVGQGVDLALIHFSAPVASITPAQIYGGSLEPVFVGVFAGYGKPGTAGNGFGTWDHVRRAGQNTIGDTYWPYSESQYLLSMFDEAAYGGAQPIEWQGSPGDSGGASFLRDNGQLALVAINSFAVNHANYGIGSATGTLNITLPEYRDWIAAMTHPKLTLQALGNGGFRLSWPSAASGFLLQTQVTLSSTNWVSVGSTVADDGTNRSLVVTNTGPSGFWRLAKPAGPTPPGPSIRRPPSGAPPSSNFDTRPFWDDLLPGVAVPLGLGAPAEIPQRIRQAPGSGTGDSARQGESQ